MSRCARSCWTILSARAAARANLKVFIEAAKSRGEALDHVLFVGPPRAQASRRWRRLWRRRSSAVNFRSSLRPGHRQGGDLGALLTNLRDRDVLFNREIHRPQSGGRRNPLYQAME